jgi:hypothetical protein
MCSNNESDLLRGILTALNSRSNYQTYLVRENEILEASALVKHYNFLPRFILIPVDGLLVSLPISEYTWESIKRDALDLNDDISHVIEYKRDGNRLHGCVDAFNIPAALL